MASDARPCLARDGIPPRKIFFIELFFKSEVFKRYADISFFGTAYEQYHKAYCLAQHRGAACSADAHFKYKYKYGVKQNIEHSARRNAYHPVYRAALKAKLIIKHKRAHHKRCSAENVKKILLCVRQNGIG